MPLLCVARLRNLRQQARFRRQGPFQKPTGRWTHCGTLTVARAGPNRTLRQAVEAEREDEGYFGPVSRRKDDAGKVQHQPGVFTRSAQAMVAQAAPELRRQSCGRPPPQRRSSPSGLSSETSFLGNARIWPRPVRAPPG
jgi:hypothetical protein